MKRAELAMVYAASAGVYLRNANCPVIIAAAIRYQIDADVSPQDSIIFASVISYLDQHRDPPSCFLTKNREDFDDPDMVAELAARNCKVLYTFRDGLSYLQRANP